MKIEKIVNANKFIKQFHKTLLHSIYEYGAPLAKK